MTQQQQKAIISSLQMSLEAGPPPGVSSQSIAPTGPSAASATSQLLQQLQQPLDVKPTPQNVNNPSSVNKSVSIPNAITTKLEQQQPSPTGNNNTKSNINLNHMNQPMPTSVNPMNPSLSLPQQLQQQQSMLSSSLTSAMNVPITTGNGMQAAPAVTTPSIIQQQLTNNNSNPNQAKHQTPYGMNTFIDPLEHSLASLEQPQMNNLQKNSSQDMNTILMQQMLMNQLTVPHIGPGSNGFGQTMTDFNGANGAVTNSLINMLALPGMDPSSLFLNTQMKNVQGRFPETWNNIPGNNPMMQLTAQQQQQMQNQQQQQLPHPPQQQHHQQHQQHLQQQSSVKQEKIMLTPKPIEELLINPHEKTKGHGGPNAPPPFGQAFNKYEQNNLKNASSWSQLAAAGSPQNPGASVTSKSKVPSDTFQEYRTKAKEQQQRQKQEQEKMKKQKEQELKRQQESLQKHKTEDLSNGHR